MSKLQQHRLRRLAFFGLTIAAGAVLGNRLWADAPVSIEQSSAAPSLLEQLSNETQKLYRKSRHSMVRVQLPAPQWLEQYNERQALLKKWGKQLDPQVREKILEEQERSNNALRRPATMPSSQQSDFGVIPTSQSSTLSGVVGGASPETQPAKGSLQVTDAPRVGEVSLSLYAVGLIVDDQGHAVFPVYVDRKHFSNLVMSAITGDGKITTATFVGSDVKTNLTVLQLADHTGVPAALGNARPDDGELTLMIAPDGGSRLLVWNNQHPDAGFAVLPDASIAGFGFDGHFLGASTAKPIVDQLISFGEVRRAILGVITQEVDRDDGMRRQRPELGTKPAIHILAVQNGSAADRGGLRPDDLVLAIGDQLVGDAPTFAAVIATRTGDTSLKVLRGGKVVDLTVNLQPK